MLLLPSWACILALHCSAAALSYNAESVLYPWLPLDQFRQSLWQGCDMTMAQEALHLARAIVVAMSMSRIVCVFELGSSV